MSRYYFNLHNDVVTIDEEGVELQDEGAARAWAVNEIRFHAGESIKEHAHLVLSHRLVIRDETQSEVATIHFGDVVKVTH